MTNKNRRWIMDSEYVAHYGSHTDFEDKMSMLIDEVYNKSPDRVIFIGDGARWQWKWAEAEYPKSKKIIDYYHVMEHVGTYIHHVTKTIGDKDKYVKKIGKILKYKGIKTVKRYIEKIPRKTQHIKKEFSKLTTYFRNNEHMMDYPLYRKSNYLIGSGAIESAHRTVLQKRMKQSGQRWSERGLKNMINLRVLYMSGYKDNVHEIIKNVA